MDLESERTTLITMPQQQQPQQQLAGKPLEKPRFHKTDWKIGDKFQDKDDIDRTKTTPWRLPSFLHATPWNDDDDTSLGRTTTVEQKLLPVLSSSSSSTTPETAVSKTTTTTFASAIKNVLSQEQCAEMISCINSKGFTPALLNVGGGFQMYAPHIRDGNRAIVDSPEMAAYLFHVLRPYLPETIGGDDNNDMQLVDLNERLRFLCYNKPGQQFELHTDGMYQRPQGHVNAGDISMITVQLYLHDLPKEFGGATTFSLPESMGESMGLSMSMIGDDNKVKVAYQPEAGSVLLFTQDLPHEGSKVEQGIKYTVRTEVMYRFREN
jgi:hypothetical protein